MKFKRFISRHLFLVLILLSSFVLTVLGGVQLCLLGADYMEQQSLSAYAIHNLRSGKSVFFDLKEGSFKEDGAPGAGDLSTEGDENEEGFFAVAEKNEDSEDYDYFDDDDDEEDGVDDLYYSDIEEYIDESESDENNTESNIEENNIEENDAGDKDDGDNTGNIEQPDFLGETTVIDRQDADGAASDGSLDLDKLGSIVEEKDKAGSSSKKKKDGSSSGKKDKGSSSKKKNKKPWLHPKWIEVDEDYFRDAVFIGDSRQQGFGLYSKLPDITVYAQKGFQIYTAATKRIVETPFGNITIGEALKVNEGKFKKVYLMFGLNEMGWGTPEKLDAYYYNLIDYVKETQPDAVIFLESIIHVTDKKAKSNYIFSNEAIDLRNKHLKKIAEDEHIYYLDLNEIFTDENNALFPDAAADGVHMKAEYIEKWKDYLMSHAIKPHKKKSDDKDEDEKEELSYEDRLRELFGIGPGGSSIDAISGEGMKLMGIDPNLYYQGADGNVYLRFTGPGFDDKTDKKADESEKKSKKKSKKESKKESDD